MLKTSVAVIAALLASTNAVRVQQANAPPVADPSVEANNLQFLSHYYRSMCKDGFTSFCNVY